MPDDALTGREMIFIVGSPRSGTTWLQKLLACCPAVRTGQESDLFDLFVGPQLRNWRTYLDGRIAGRPGVALSGYLREEEFLAALRRYMGELMRPMTEGLEPGAVFVEKTPSHALFLPEIMELLPGSRIIHMVRDARDVTASLLAASRSWGKLWAPSTARGAAAMWRRHVQAVYEARDRVPDGQFFEVRYEALLDDPRSVLMRLERELLHLCWDEAGIGEAVARHPPGGGGVAGSGDLPLAGEAALKAGDAPNEPEGFVRRAKAGGWRDSLGFVDRVRVWREASEVMARAGYPWPLPL